jgi:proteasome lid subunit RPN8/RPN11
VKISRAAFDALQAHAAEGYPNEICGVLVGSAGEMRATDAKRARNTVVDRARDRYELDPIDHMRIQREADAAGLDIVGYYHSHPDHPAKPSMFDAERSWAGLVYVIVSVEKGRPVDVNGFVAEKDGGPFRSDPEPLEVS